jgi:hypothetical protein
MANTFKKIQTITVGSGGSSSIEFTSIPQTYTDLRIVLSARSLQGNVYGGGALQFNSDTGSNYKWVRARGDGSATASDYSSSATSITNWDVAGANATASVFGTVIFDILNYTSSNYKSIFLEYTGENNATEAHMGMNAGIWTSTSAITSIKLFSSGNNYVQYTTATLYGISNVVANEGAKATGGVITYDSNYIYHTFLSSDTFTPTQNLTVDYLVVAGGGGGGTAVVSQDTGGGGGAGGLRCTVGATGGGGSLESALSLTASTNYTVTIGGGGGANTAGSNSVFGSITSTGGGKGAGNNSSANGGTGGSGGGGRGTGLNTGVTGGAGTANQGYAGGNGTDQGVTYGGGGGGGAGAVGSNGSSTVGGNGGNGVTTSISGTSTTYGGGGGGGASEYGGTGGNAGTGGTGGGGNGGKQTVGTAGTANTGGGGGGGGAKTGVTSAGSAGGSGIVIVRYAR